MESITLVGAVQAIFLSLFLASKRGKSLPDYILMSLLIFTSIPLFYYYFNYNITINSLNKIKFFPNFYFFINVPFTISFAPMIYIYIKSNFVLKENFFPKNLWPLIPTFIFLILTFIFVDLDELKEYGFYSLNPILTFIFNSFIPFSIVLTVYLILKSFKLIKIHQYEIKQNYSYIEDIDFEWLRIFLIITTILWIIFIPVGMILIKLEKIIIVYQVVLILLSVSVFIIGFYGFHHSNIFILHSLKNETQQANLKSSDSKSNEDYMEDIKQLKKYMETEKPYLEYKLSLAQLSLKMGWSTTYLSKILNKELNQNFYEFVNFYRMEEVKKLLKNESKYTNLGVAFDCGFNSKSSFHRIFKEVTGKTPNEYKKSLPPKT